MKRLKEKKVINDFDLIQDYLKTKDSTQFKILYNRHNSFIINLIKSFTKDKTLIKDYSQDIWIVLLSKLEKFDGENFRGWLRIMTKNHCIDKFRKNKRYPPPIELPEFKLSIVDDFDLIEIKDEERRIQHVFNEIDKLQDTQKNVVKLRILGKKYDEISVMLNKSKGTCQPAYKLAIKKLRKKLSKI